MKDVVEGLQRQIADYIDSRYRDPPRYRRDLWQYWYCGKFIVDMSLEEASNVVQTKLTYGA